MNPNSKSVGKSVVLVAAKSVEKAWVKVHLCRYFEKKSREIDGVSDRVPGATGKLVAATLNPKRSSAM